MVNETEIQQTIDYLVKDVGISYNIAKKIAYNRKIKGFDLVKTKVEFFIDFLNVSKRELAQVISKWPQILGYNVTGKKRTSATDKTNKKRTSVIDKAEYYIELLGITQQEFAKMVIRYPAILGYDVDDTSESSVGNKINRMMTFLPKEKIKQMIVEYPRLLAVPYNSFKIRYMMAKIFNVESKFLTEGYLVNERKVWARARALKVKGYTYCSVYACENKFSHQIIQSSEMLMQRYPLDQDVIDQIEQKYFLKTGFRVRLDESERASALGE